MLVLLVYVAVIGLVWLLPLYFLCQWAERQKKDHRVVFLVGLVTGWVIALIVALLLPELSEEKLAAMKRKSAGEPMGETGIILGALGGCTLVLLLFMAWMAWGI